MTVVIGPRRQTRQRRWQLAQMARGLCSLCPERRATSQYCEEHRKAIVIRRARLRLVRGSVLSPFRQRCSVCRDFGHNAKHPKHARAVAL